MVYDVCGAVQIPVVGLGGITTGEDVVQFLLAGATAVQLGTVNFTDPAASLRILGELESYCTRCGVSSLEELRGAARL